MAQSLNGEESVKKFIRAGFRSSPKLSVAFLGQSPTHPKKFQNDCLKNVAKNCVTDRQMLQINILGKKTIFAKKQTNPNAIPSPSARVKIYVEIIETHFSGC